MNNWISVEEQPLPRDREILAINKDNEQAVVWYHEYEGFISAARHNCCGGISFEHIDNITHWMDLPGLP